MELVARQRLGKARRRRQGSSDQTRFLVRSGRELTGVTSAEVEPEERRIWDHGSLLK